MSLGTTLSRTAGMVIVLTALVAPGCKAQSSVVTTRFQVVATEGDGIAAARRKTELERRFGQPLQVVASTDCRNLRAGLFLVVLRSQTATLRQARGVVSDAYQRQCNLDPRAISPLEIDAVDPSFASSVEAVNWSSADATARIAGTLADRSALVIRPYWVNVPEDSQEGLRTAVEVVAKGRNGRISVSQDCRGAVVSLDGTVMALACSVEQRAEQDVYETRVIDLTSGVRVLKTIARCANPKVVARIQAVNCALQTFDHNGAVVTTPSSVRF